MPKLKCIHGLCADKMFTGLAKSLGCGIDPNVYTFINLLVLTPLITYLLLEGSSIGTWIFLAILTILRAFLDIADGIVARTCNKQSKFGARLDIIGDALFVLAISVATIYVWVKHGIKNRILFMIVAGILLGLNYSMIHQVVEELLAGDKTRELSDFVTIIADSSWIVTLVLVLLVKFYILYLKNNDAVI